MHYKIFSICVQVLFLIAVVSSLILSQELALAELTEPLSRVYGFRVDLSNLGIAPRYVNVIDDSRVLIVGSIGGVYGIAVLNVANPYADPVVEDLYPLTGTPTYVTTDGYPATRIAVGSDKGEVLLLKVDKGRITRHLYVVLGADFYINEVILAKGAGGNVKIVTLVSEGGPRGYPCMNCHIYVLDEDATGVLRIGPKVGNASATCPGLENINVQDVIPLTVYGYSGYYWDLSNVAVTYIPMVIKLVFNVTYINETTGELTPLPGALVEVSLVYNETGNRVVYGINADSEGVARVPIPYEKESVLLINLTIRDINGTVRWRYSFTYDPSAYREIPDEIVLPPAVLSTMSVDVRSATKVYGVPPFLNVLLDLVDLTYAPFSCIRKASATFFIKPSVRDLALLQGEADSRIKIMYTDPDEGFLNIVVASLTYTNISQITRVSDYVGYNAVIVASGTFNDGGYLIAGLSDGRLRMYVAQSESYRLKDIYTMGSPLLNLVTIPGVEGYTYVAVSSSGIQVLRVEPYPLPVYRNLASLYLSTPGYVHGDALADLSTIALIDSRGITVIKNSDIAVNNRLTLTVEKIMARDVEISINMPGNEDVSGTIVALNYPGGLVEHKLNESKLILKNIIPGTNYTVHIYPQWPYIYNASVTFMLGDNLQIEVLDQRNAVIEVDHVGYKLTVNLKYMAYSVKLRVLDEITGSEPIVPVDIYVDGKVIAEATRSSEHLLKLVYGDRNITIQPSKGFEKVYQVYATTTKISSDTEISVKVKRVEYIVAINVADIYGTIISPVDVIISGPVTLTQTVEAPGELIQLLLPYGEYQLNVTPHNASIYAPYTTTLLVDSSRNMVVTIQRIKYKLEINVTDRFGVTGKFELYANGTKIADNFDKQAVIDIPYGVYVLRLTPMSAWEAVYEPSKPITVTIASDTSITIPVNRRTYRLRVSVLERGEPISNAAIHIYSVITGELITVLTTDTNGVMETSVPYGAYRLVVRHENYVEEVVVLAVEKDISEVITLKPTIVTLARRYAPIIGALIGVGVALYVVMRIRAIIVKRLVREEMF